MCCCKHTKTIHTIYTSQIATSACRITVSRTADIIMLKPDTLQHTCLHKCRECSSHDASTRVIICDQRRRSVMLPNVVFHFRHQVPIAVCHMPCLYVKLVHECCPIKPTGRCRWVMACSWLLSTHEVLAQAQWSTQVAPVKQQAIISAACRHTCALDCSCNADLLCSSCKPSYGTIAFTGAWLTSVQRKTSRQTWCACPTFLVHYGTVDLEATQAVCQLLHSFAVLEFRPISQTCRKRKAGTPQQAPRRYPLLSDRYRVCNASVAVRPKLAFWKLV